MAQATVAPAEERADLLSREATTASTVDETAELLSLEEAGGRRRSRRELRGAFAEGGSSDEEQDLPPWWSEVPPLPGGISARGALAVASSLALVCLLVAAVKRDSTSWRAGHASGTGAVVSLTGRSGTTMRHASGTGAVVSLTGRSGTTMRWLAHPTKCLDVAGTSGGAGLQIWDCDPNYPYQQEFLVPTDGMTGRIKWARNPSLCLDAPGGPALQFWSCNETPPEHTLWTISPDGKGRIHLAAHPELCVDVPDEDVDNGWKMQVWPCHNYSNGVPDRDMRFITHPVDCRWSAWSEWGPCSKSCGGGGEHWRSRSVAAAAVNGGRECGGGAREAAPCGAAACAAEVATTSPPPLGANSSGAFQTQLLTIREKRRGRGGAARAVPLLPTALFSLLASAAAA